MEKAVLYNVDDMEMVLLDKIKHNGCMMDEDEFNAMIKECGYIKDDILKIIDDLIEQDLLEKKYKNFDVVEEKEITDTPLFGVSFIDIYVIPWDEGIDIEKHMRSRGFIN